MGTALSKWIRMTKGFCSAGLCVTALTPCPGPPCPQCSSVTVMSCWQIPICGCWGAGRIMQPPGDSSLFSFLQSESISNFSPDSAPGQQFCNPALCEARIAAGADSSFTAPGGGVCVCGHTSVTTCAGRCMSLQVSVLIGHC